MEEDPYSPPASGMEEGPVAGKVALREIVLGWEKLRLTYNLLLLLPGLAILALMVVRQQMPVGPAVAGAVMIGIGANAAFLAGPLAELYFRGLLRNGEPIGRGRLLIFGAGMVVSAGVFGLALLMALA